jgi:hypothetical protein
MKNILYIVLGIVLMMSVSSCYKDDNWDAPDARVHGKIIDSYTGENLLTSQGDWGIRIWEKTWTGSVPTSQSLNVMQDGSYNNTKLFSGTYDMLPYGGAFWPVDTTKDVAFNGTTEQDFTVTPYLQVIGFETSLNGLNLNLTCQLKAPIRDGLPNLVEIKPFLSYTQFSGSTNFIDKPEFTNSRKQINQSWIDTYGDVDTSPIIHIGPITVKPGYTYYVRIGANVNDANRKYNYSPIVKIIVPADAHDDPNTVPDNFFVNAQWPFSKDEWDGSRWGNLLNWKTNEAMRTRNGMGGYDGGWEAGTDRKSLGFERWGDGETPIVNGKLYQTFNLPAGSYKMTLTFPGENPIKSNNGDDKRYIAAAIGEELPDTEDIGTALASKDFHGLSPDDGIASIEFTLDTPQKVTAGFVVNFISTEQNVRPSIVKLEKVD